MREPDLQVGGEIIRTCRSKVVDRPDTDVVIPIVETSVTARVRLVTPVRLSGPTDRTLANTGGVISKVEM